MSIYHSPCSNSLGHHQPRVTKNCRFQPKESSFHHPSWCQDCAQCWRLTTRLWSGICQDVQRLCKLAKPALSAILIWQNLPLASLLSPPLGCFTCPLKLLRWVGLTTFSQTHTSLMMSVWNTSSVGLARMPQRCTCPPGDVLLLYTTEGCFLEDVTKLLCMPTVTTPSYGFGVLGSTGQLWKKGLLH